MPFGFGCFRVAVVVVVVVVVVGVVFAPNHLCAQPTIFAYTFLQSQQLIVNPKPFLADLTGKHVRVRLKWGQEYQGKLASSDAYMNLQLEETEEFIDGHFAGALGEVLIRCNNVLYIKAADLKGGGGGANMDE